ncbi:MAG: hypothetical protein QG608_141 [Actinomycetota bacterium]|nr:hypothetical protein [Actinomycetota bacterium]
MRCRVHRKRRDLTAALALAIPLTTLALAGCGDGSALAPSPSLPTATSTSGSGSSGEDPTTTSTTSPVYVTPESHERDAAVRAMRQEYRGSAKAINAKDVNVVEWEQSTTDRRRAELAQAWSADFGRKAPGPIPFTPLTVLNLSETKREVVFCVVSDGWMLDPVTNNPAKPWTVTHAKATVIKVDSRWRVDQMVRTSGSCGNVPIEKEYFEPSDE